MSASRRDSFDFVIGRRVELPSWIRFVDFRHKTSRGDKDEGKTKEEERGREEQRSIIPTTTNCGRHDRIDTTDPNSPIQPTQF